MGERGPLTTVLVETTPPYPVTIGFGLVANLVKGVAAGSVAVITDATVAGLHAADLQQALAAGGKRVTLLTLPPGEESKTLGHAQTLLRAMVTAGLDRGSAVVALGGGVVTDLAGFVAACFMRGVDSYLFPTSLLAMVDASVGGKTGVNLPEGKNLVGAFWQPRAVFMDLSTLETLPQRELRQGLVELFKHGLLADEVLVERALAARFGPDVPRDERLDTVTRSVRIKAEIVAADTREQAGRAILNLGHTVGHALEAASGHALSHGDAVAYGLLFAAILSARRGGRDLTPLIARFVRSHEPAPLPTRDLAALEPFLARDKKNLRGIRRFVLLEDIGKPRIVADVTAEELTLAWRTLLEVIR